MGAFVIILVVLGIVGLRILPHLILATRELKNKELKGLDIDWQYVELEEQRLDELQRK